MPGKADLSRHLQSLPDEAALVRLARVAKLGYQLEPLAVDVIMAQDVLFTLMGNSDSFG